MAGQPRTPRGKTTKPHKRDKTTTTHKRQATTKLKRTTVAIKTNTNSHSIELVDNDTKTTTNELKLDQSQTKPKTRRSHSITKDSNDSTSIDNNNINNNNNLAGLSIQDRYNITTKLNNHNYNLVLDQLFVESRHNLDQTPHTNLSLYPTTPLYNDTKIKKNGIAVGNDDNIEDTRPSPPQSLSQQLFNLPFSYPVSRSIPLNDGCDNNNDESTNLNQIKSNTKVFTAPSQDTVYSHYLAAIQPPHHHNLPLSPSNTPSRSRLPHITHNSGEDTINYQQQLDEKNQLLVNFQDKLNNDPAKLQMDQFQNQMFEKYNIDPAIDHPNPFLRKGIAVKKFVSIIASLWALHNQVTKDLGSSWESVVKGDPYEGVAKLFAGYGFHHERNVLNLTKLTILEKLIRDKQVILDDDNNNNNNSNNSINEHTRAMKHDSDNNQLEQIGFKLGSKKSLNEDNNSILTNEGENLAVDLSPNGFALQNESSDLFLELRNNTLRDFSGEYLSLNVQQQVKKFYPHLKFRDNLIDDEKIDDQDDINTNHTTQSTNENDDSVELLPLDEDTTPYNGDIAHQIGFKMTLDHLKKGSYILYQSPIFGNDIDIQKGLQTTVKTELDEEFNQHLTLREKVIYSNMVNGRTEYYDYLLWDMNGLHSIDHLTIDTTNVLNKQKYYDENFAQRKAKIEMENKHKNIAPTQWLPHQTTTDITKKAPTSSTIFKPPLVELLFPSSSTDPSTHPGYMSKYAKFHPQLNLLAETNGTHTQSNNSLEQHLDYNTDEFGDMEDINNNGELPPELSKLLKNKFNLDINSPSFSKSPLRDTPTGTAITNQTESYFYSLRAEVNEAAATLLSPTRLQDVQTWTFFLRELTIPFTSRFEPISKNNRKLDTNGIPIGNLARNGKSGNLGQNTLSSIRYDAKEEKNGSINNNNNTNTNDNDNNHTPPTDLHDLEWEIPDLDSDEQSKNSNNDDESPVLKDKNPLGKDIYNSQFDTLRHKKTQSSSTTAKNIGLDPTSSSDVPKSDSTKHSNTTSRVETYDNFDEMDEEAQNFQQRQFYTRGSADFIVRVGAQIDPNTGQKIHLYELWDTKLRKDVAPKDLLQTLSYAVILNQKLHEQNEIDLMEFRSNGGQTYTQPKNFDPIEGLSHSLDCSNNVDNLGQKMPKNAKITHVCIVHGTGRISRVPINAAYTQLVARVSAMFQYFLKEYHPLNPPQLPATIGGGGYYSNFLSSLWNEGGLLQLVSDFRENRITSLLAAGYSTVSEVAQSLLYHSKYPTEQLNRTLLHNFGGYTDTSAINQQQHRTLTQLRQQVVYVPTITGQTEHLNIISAHSPQQTDITSTTSRIPLSTGNFDGSGNDPGGNVLGGEFTKFDSTLYTLPLDHFNAQFSPHIAKLYRAEANSITGQQFGGNNTTQLSPSTFLNTNHVKLNVPGFTGTTINDLNSFVTTAKYHLVELLHESGIINITTSDNNQIIQGDEHNKNLPNNDVNHKNNELPSITMNFDYDGHGLSRLIDRNVDPKSPFGRKLAKLDATFQKLQNGDDDNEQSRHHRDDFAGEGNDDEIGVNGDNNPDPTTLISPQQKRQNKPQFDGVVDDPNKLYKLVSSILPDLGQIATVSALPPEAILQIPQDQQVQIVLMHLKEQMEAIYEIFMHFTLTNSTFQHKFAGKLALAQQLQKQVDTTTTTTPSQLTLETQLQPSNQQVLHPLQGLMLLHPQSHSFTFVRHDGLQVMPPPCPQGGDVYFDLEGAGNVLDTDAIVLSTFTNNKVKKMNSEIRRQYLQTFSRFYSIRSAVKLDYLYGLCYKQKLSQWLAQHQDDDKGDIGVEDEDDDMTKMDPKQKTVKNVLLDEKTGTLRTKKSKKQVMFKKIDNGLYALTIQEPISNTKMSHYYQNEDHNGYPSLDGDNDKGDKQLPLNRRGIRSETIYIRVDNDGDNSDQENDNNHNKGSVGQNQGNVGKIFYNGKIPKKLKIVDVYVKNHHISQDGDFELQLTYPKIKNHKTKGTKLTKMKSLYNKKTPTQQQKSTNTLTNDINDDNINPPPTPASETVSNLFHTFVTLARHHKIKNLQNDNDDINATRGTDRAAVPSPTTTTNQTIPTTTLPTTLTIDEANEIYQQIKNTEVTVFIDWWGHTSTQELAAYTETIDFLHERKRKYPMMNIYHYAFYEINAMKANLIRLASNRLNILEQLLNQRSTTNTSTSLLSAYGHGKTWGESIIPAWIKDEKYDQRAEQMLIVAQNRATLEKQSKNDKRDKHGNSINSILVNSKNVGHDEFDNAITNDVDYLSPKQRLTDVYNPKQLVLYAKKIRTQCQSIQYVYNHLVEHLPSLTVVIDDVNTQVEELIDHYYELDDGNEDDLNSIDDDNVGHNNSRSKKWVKQQKTIIENELRSIIAQQLALLQQFNQFSVQLTNLGYQAQDISNTVHHQIISKLGEIGLISSSSNDNLQDVYNSDDSDNIHDIIDGLQYEVGKTMKLVTQYIPTKPKQVPTTTNSNDKKLKQNKSTSPNDFNTLIDEYRTNFEIYKTVSDVDIILPDGIDDGSDDFDHNDIDRNSKTTHTKNATKKSSHSFTPTHISKAFYKFNNHINHNIDNIGIDIDTIKTSDEFFGTQNLSHLIIQNNPKAKLYKINHTTKKNQTVRNILHNSKRNVGYQNYHHNYHHNNNRDQKPYTSTTIRNLTPQLNLETTTTTTTGPRRFKEYNQDKAESPPRHHYEKNTSPPKREDGYLNFKPNQNIHNQNTHRTAKHGQSHPQKQEEAKLLEPQQQQQQQPKLESPDRDNNSTNNKTLHSGNNYHADNQDIKIPQLSKIEESLPLTREESRQRAFGGIPIDPSAHDHILHYQYLWNRNNNNDDVNNDNNIADVPKMTVFGELMSNLPKRNPMQPFKIVTKSYLPRAIAVPSSQQDNPIYTHFVEHQNDYDKGRFSNTSRLISKHNLNLRDLDDLIAGVYTESHKSNMKHISDVTSLGRTIFNFTALRLRIHTILRDLKVSRERYTTVSALPRFYLDITEEIYEDFLTAHNPGRKRQISTNSTDAHDSNDNNDDMNDYDNDSTSRLLNKKRRKQVEIETLYQKPQPGMYEVDIENCVVTQIDQDRVFNSRHLYDGQIIDPRRADLVEIEVLQRYQAALQDRLEFIVEEMLVRTADMMVMVYHANKPKKEQSQQNINHHNDYDFEDITVNNLDNNAHVPIKLSIPRILKNQIKIHGVQVINGGVGIDGKTLAFSDDSPAVSRTNDNQRSQFDGDDDDDDDDIDGLTPAQPGQSNDKDNNNKTNAGGNNISLHDELDDDIQQGLGHDTSMMAAKLAKADPAELRKLHQQRSRMLQFNDEDENDESYPDEYAQHVHMTLLKSLATLLIENYREQNGVYQQQLQRQEQQSKQQPGSILPESKLQTKGSRVYLANEDELQYNWIDFDKVQKNALQRIIKRFSIDMDDLEYGYQYRSPYQIKMEEQIKRAHKLLHASQKQIDVFKQQPETFLIGTSLNQLAKRYRQMATDEQLDQFIQQHRTPLYNQASRRKGGARATVVGGDEDGNKNPPLLSISPNIAKKINQNALVTSALLPDDESLLTIQNGITGLGQEILNNEQLTQKLNQLDFLNPQSSTNNNEKDLNNNNNLLSKQEIDEQLEILRNKAMYARLLLVQQYGGTEGYLNAVNNQTRLLEDEIVSLEQMKSSPQHLYQQLLRQQMMGSENDDTTNDTDDSNMTSSDSISDKDNVDTLKSSDVITHPQPPLPPPRPRQPYNQLLQHRLAMAQRPTLTVGQQLLNINNNNNNTNNSNNNNTSSSGPKGAAKSVFAALSQVEYDQNDVQEAEKIHEKVLDEQDVWNRRWEKQQIAHEEQRQKYLAEKRKFDELQREERRKLENEQREIQRKIDEEQKNMQLIAQQQKQQQQQQSQKQSSVNSTINNNKSTKKAQRALEDSHKELELMTESIFDLDPSSSSSPSSQNKSTPPVANKIIYASGDLPDFGSFSTRTIKPNNQKGPKRNHNRMFSTIINTQQKRLFSSSSSQSQSIPLPISPPEESGTIKPKRGRPAAGTTTKKTIGGVDEKIKKSTKMATNPLADSTVTRTTKAAPTAKEKAGEIKGSTAQRGSFFDVYPVVRYNLRFSTKSGSLKEIEKLVLNPLKQRKLFLGAVQQIKEYKDITTVGKNNTTHTNNNDKNTNDGDDDMSTGLSTRSGDVKAAKDSLIAYYAWRYRLHTLNHFETIFSLNNSDENNNNNDQNLFNPTIQKSDSSETNNNTTNNNTNNNIGTKKWNMTYLNDLNHFADVDQAVVIAQADQNLYGVDQSANHDMRTDNNVDDNNNVNFPKTFTQSPQYVTPTSFYPPGLSPLPQLPSELMSVMETQLTSLQTQFNTLSKQTKNTPTPTQSSHLTKLASNITTLKTKIEQIKFNDDKLHDELIALRDYNKQDCVNLMLVTQWLQDLRVQQRELLGVNGTPIIPKLTTTNAFGNTTNGNNSDHHDNDDNVTLKPIPSIPSQKSTKMTKIKHDFAQVKDSISRASMLFNNVHLQLQTLSTEIDHLTRINNKIDTFDTIEGDTRTIGNEIIGHNTAHVVDNNSSIHDDNSGSDDADNNNVTNDNAVNNNNHNNKNVGDGGNNSDYEEDPDVKKLLSLKVLNQNAVKAANLIATLAQLQKAVQQKKSAATTKTKKAKTDKTVANKSSNTPSSSEITPDSAQNVDHQEQAPKKRGRKKAVDATAAAAAATTTTQTIVPDLPEVVVEDNVSKKRGVKKVIATIPESILGDIGDDIDIQPKPVVQKNQRKAVAIDIAAPVDIPVTVKKRGRPKKM